MHVSSQDMENFKILLINEDLGAAGKMLSSNYVRLQAVLSHETI